MLNENQKREIKKYYKRILSVSRSIPMSDDDYSGCEGALIGIEEVLSIINENELIKELRKIKTF